MRRALQIQITQNCEWHSVSGPGIGYENDRVNLSGRKKEKLSHLDLRENEMRELGTRMEC